MILKTGDEYTSEVDAYHSYRLQRPLWVLETRLGVKTWKFLTHTSLTHAIKAYLRPLLRFSSLMATFEIFPQQKLGIEKYAHIQFRSRHAHFKSRRWCKLNFGLLQGKVKSHHFSERTEAKRQYFYFLHTIFGIFDWKQHWKTLHESVTLNITLKIVKTRDCPALNYMFKVNNRNTKTRYELCSKLTIKTPERRRIYNLS